MKHQSIDQQNQSSAQHQIMAKLFEKVWSSGTYQGFSKDTMGAYTTPFLEVFIEEMKKLGRKQPTVAELGAGSGDHSLRFAAESFDTTAVESSQTATALMRQRIATAKDSVRFKVIEKNLFDYAKSMENGKLDGIYANSVLHFLTPTERKYLYTHLFRIQSPGGILGVSFKGFGDALQKRGKTVENTPSGPVVEGDDGVRRLFVTDSNPLIEEICGAGYEFIGLTQWNVPNYNVEGEDGVFLGLRAKKL